jgi:hypothetical protein
MNIPKCTIKKTNSACPGRVRVTFFGYLRHEHLGNVVNPDDGGFQPVKEHDGKEVPAQKKDSQDRHQIGQNQGQYRVSFHSLNYRGLLYVIDME